MSKSKPKKYKIEGKVSFEIEYIGKLNSKLRHELDLMQDDLIYLIADTGFECTEYSDSEYNDDFSIMRKVKVKLKKVT